MMQAMNTGHEGSLTTVHANSPRDALSRIENMVLMAGFDLPIRAIREQMASAFHIIVQLARFADGSRRIVSIQRSSGYGRRHRDDARTLQVRRYQSIEPDGRIVGSAEANRHRADVF